MPLIDSVSEADGRSFSVVGAGTVMPVAESMTLPDPTSSTLILLLARPGPEPTVIWKPSTARPTACRSRTTPAPGRICSRYERYGNSAASPAAGMRGVQVYTYGPAPV